MRIDELDEFQGVTPQLVTGWLLANGWTQTKPPWWERGKDAFIFDSETFDQLWFWIHALAAIYTNGNVQALLREINPRMRKGMPSKAAQAAHAGHWIVSDSETGCLGIQQTHMLGWGDCSLFAYWPCDEHGNKVRWPVDAKGSML